MSPTILEAYLQVILEEAENKGFIIKCTGPEGIMSLDSLKSKTDMLSPKALNTGSPRHPSNL
ncbi:MAG: hypothetical protein AB8B53_03660 [Flavobacteriales bacterium]